MKKNLLPSTPPPFTRRCIAPLAGLFLLLLSAISGYGQNTGILKRALPPAASGDLGAYVDNAQDSKPLSFAPADYPYEITYTITQPIVNQKSPVVYDGVSASPAIHFEPGDSVIITAGGCVQTGGSGLTWKRYVNPSGPNSDRYYFCTIQIPGLTAGMVPLRNTGGGIQASHLDIYTIHFPNRIPANLNGQNPYLILGYTDDDYSDNGYWSHDNGTQNQCALVGNAYLKVTIIRKFPSR